MQHPFTELQAEYESWVAHCKPRPECEHEIDQVARRLLRPEAMTHFNAVFTRLQIPQVVQATICEREDGCDFTKNPAQGDPWNQVSRHVPRGRGPFTSWDAAATDAWTVCDRLNVLSVPAWSLAYSCWKWEYYNGGGYRAHGVRTPYVLGGSNLQQKGKYVSDGEFDRTHMDTQIGCLPIAMRMIELSPDLALGDALATVAAPMLVPDPAPVPMAVGGSLTGTKWVQASLNVVEHIVPPLDVDGSFGRLTRSAIRDFQKKVGLPDTGLIDDALCNALDTSLAAAKPAMTQ